jgi:YgiT-type zinc finger domain-containing protein
MARTKITHCPTCGSDQITQVCRDWTSIYQGQSYVVPALTFYECLVCGERVFERDVVAKIRVYSPAYAAKRVKPRSAKVSQADTSTQTVSVA